MYFSIKSGRHLHRWYTVPIMWLYLWSWRWLYRKIYCLLGFNFTMRRQKGLLRRSSPFVISAQLIPVWRIWQAAGSDAPRVKKIRFILVWSVFSCQIQLIFHQKAGILFPEYCALCPMHSAHREVLLCTIPREASSPSCAPGSSFTAPNGALRTAFLQM